MIRRVVLLGLLIALVGAVGATEGQETGAGAGYLIAVAQFQGPDADLARTITETVTQDLAASGKLRLVERAQIQQAEEEMGLGQTGLVDAKTAPKLGQMVGADHVLVGSFDAIGTVVSLRARLVKVETGEIVGGAAASVEGDIAGQKSDIFRLSHQLADRFHYRLTGEWLPMHTWLDEKVDPTRLLDPGEQAVKVGVSVDRGEGSTYQFGDIVTITFSSDGDGYVHVYDVDSAGKVTPLYPNQWVNEARPIRAGQSYAIPPPGANWHLWVEGTPGQENILVIVTENQIAFDRQLGITDFVDKSVVPQLGSGGGGRWGVGKVRFYTEIPQDRMTAAAGKYVYVPSVVGMSAKGLGDEPGQLVEEGQQSLWLNEPERAEESFRQALRLDDALAQGWWGLGTAEFALAQQEEDRRRQGFSSSRDPVALYSEALEAFQRARQLMPEEIDLLYNIGTTYLALHAAGCTDIPTARQTGVGALEDFVREKADATDDLVLRARELIEQYGVRGETGYEKAPIGLPGS